MHVLGCTFCCQRLLLRRMKHIWMFNSVFWSMCRSISTCISNLSVWLHKPIRSGTSRQNSGRVGYRVTEAEVRIASGNLWNIYWHNLIFGIQAGAINLFSHVKQQYLRLCFTNSNQCSTHYHSGGTGCNQLLCYMHLSNGKNFWSCFKTRFDELKW